MEPMNHEEMPGMHHKPHHMEGGNHGHMMKPWFSWKSPIGMGFFLFTTSIALAVLLNYVLLSLIGAIMQLSHPANQGMTAQELQQLQSQSSARTQ